MTSLIEQLGIDKLPTLRVLETVDQISAGLHGYDDNGPVRVSIRPNPNPERDEKGKQIIPGDRATLRTLADHKIIIYRYDGTRRITDKLKKSQTYSVYVIDRYRFERLILELDQPYINRSPKPIPVPTVKNIIYFNPSNGEVSVNGVRSRLMPGKKYKNRAVFGLLLKYTPKPTPREEVLKTLKLTSTTKYSDTQRTYGLNHAIDSLRDALKVKKDVISLKADGVHLNATVVQVEQLPEDFRFTD